MNSLLILTEGGENIGFGHITRCSAIYNYCVEQGVDVEMLINWKGDIENPTQFKTVDWLDSTFIHNIGKSYNNVFVDSYLAMKPDYDFLKGKFGKVIAMDDYGRISDFDVDLVVNPNVHANTISYKSASVGGADYVILRGAFRNSEEKLNINDSVQHIMVTMGGSDYRGLIPMIANAMKDSDLNFTFACANEGYAKELSQKFVDNMNFSFLGYLSETEMRELMLKSDIAISACGQTLHELAFTGMPIIGICIDKDQEPNAHFYHENGVLPELLFWDNDDLVGVINNLIENYSLENRKAASDRGKQLFSPAGLDHIYKAIFA